MKTAWFWVIEFIQDGFPSGRFLTGYGGETTDDVDLARRFTSKDEAERELLNHPPTYMAVEKADF